MGVMNYLREGLNVAIIMGAGDMIAQFAVEKRQFKDWNAARTLRFSGLGIVVVAPALRTWYGVLETLVSKEQTQFRRGIKKMAMDQICFAPAFTLLLSYMVPLINGEEHNKIVQRIKDNYFSIMKRNYMLWPLAQTINFSLIPMKYQVVYVQIISLFWNCYLSVILND